MLILLVLVLVLVLVVNQLLKEGLNLRFISELVRELQYLSNSDLQDHKDQPPLQSVFSPWLLSQPDLSLICHPPQ